ncbi:DUF4132 domain-containing protein [Kineococcus sp. SYSU DK005]|uniref:DUF4132 domain-containing protein n=1 Tax=Kineococcus sp. SYSU DK005 TaxID=3383126 RepID=UPI003D7C808D
MTDVWLQRVVEDLQGSAAAGDEAELVRRLLSGHGGASEPFTSAVRSLPRDLRTRLTGAVLARSVDDVLDRAWALSLLTHDLDGALTPDDVERQVPDLAGRWTSHRPHRLAGCIEIARRAGVEVPLPLVEVGRRSVQLEQYERGPLPAALAGVRAPALNSGEAWSDAVLAQLPALGPAWRALLEHALSATSGKPSARWDERARQLLAQVGDGLRPAVVSWLALVGRPRTAPLERRQWGYDANEAFDPHNANALRGLVWTLSLLPGDAATARALGALVETSLRKVPGLGPRSPKTANAGVYALSRLEGEDALGQLARLAARVTHRTTSKEVHAALDRRAAAAGISREEVEELAVPGYGLQVGGRCVVHLGRATAELAVADSDVTLTWRNAAGKVVKSVPAAVRREHREELQELKATAKDVAAMLSAQVERVDRQFLARRTWPFTAWRERYLDHPLVGTIARRLIWVVDGTPLGWADGALRGLDEAAAEPGADAEVRLWHPAGRDVGEVLAWREWLTRHEVVQPFKQAHREVYLLTDAERATATYSNRFAAHVVRQHQFNALAAARGWTHRLRLMVDGSFPPAIRDLPRWGLRAEFWVEGAGEEYGQDTTEAGAYLRLTTDQVRFYPRSAPENTSHGYGGGYESWSGTERQPAAALELQEVPTLVLSEVLRDVDLFVGVASVGNDPTWQDGGPQGRFRAYWQSYSFGELSATAATRRDLLARLVPRLAIAERCSLRDRFLVVRGDLRTYKIHLGSGNVLMEPNDQYLCIVAKQTPDAGSDAVFLPFEGDRTLEVILSKALLLADDSAITDVTITSQIRCDR